MLGRSGVLSLTESPPARRAAEYGGGGTAVFLRVPPGLWWLRPLTTLQTGGESFVVRRRTLSGRDPRSPCPSSIDGVFLTLPRNATSRNAPMTNMKSTTAPARVHLMVAGEWDVWSARDALSALSAESILVTDYGDESLWGRVGIWWVGQMTEGGKIPGEGREAVVKQGILAP
ncbi:hypothetical protein BC834DRAFT_878074 [Gloeopeniophorella convolvens]|nr:hypothetical protein BC834DRAFT_878074 [Gloeopeniophorella convolvens]